MHNINLGKHRIGHVIYTDLLWYISLVEYSYSTVEASKATVKTN